MKLQSLCPAKVNLFLEVTGRRPDGYHRLDTLMAKINLYDVLDIETEPHEKIVLTVEGEGGLSAGPDNLVYRAADAFRRAFRVRQGLRLHLIKRIPMGAGLGGGSSDAAGTLLGLTRLFRFKFDARRRAVLSRLALKLGADVPFFMHPSVFCRAAGIGERLKPIKISPKCLPDLVVAFPGFGISTAEAFKALQKPSRPDVLTRVSQLDKLVKSLQKGRPLSQWQAYLFNRLEEVPLPALSQVGLVRRIMARLGLEGVRMTGSGSAVFGFAPSPARAQEIVEILRGYPWKVFLTCCNG